MRVVLCSLSVLLAGAGGAEAPAKVDLAALVERAQQGPRVEMARAQERSATAKRDEVARVTLPQGELTLLGGPSPEIRCVPSLDECVTTEPNEAGLHFDGLFGRADLRLTWPLYTFGKRARGLEAAGAGVAAASALVEAGTRDAMVDAARAYYGVKLGRELTQLLEEGADTLREALRRLEAEAQNPDSEVGEAERRRLRVLQTEVGARLSEARKLERVAMAGVRALWGGEVELDDAPLAPLPGRPPPLEEVTRAAGGRPDVRAAEAGAEAVSALAAVERARYWPDLALVGQGTLARSNGVDNPRNAFFNDPYNASSAALGLALRWTLDMATRGAKVRAAEADAARAEHGARLARAGAELAARQAWAEAEDAQGRLAATREGEAEARAWLVSNLQAEAAGLVDVKELGDALQAWFSVRARRAQAEFDWNLAVFSLVRAMGGSYPETHALPP